VLGMHRSGTSPLTRLLGLCGADLPRRSLEANFANATGYWEPADIVEIHRELLEAVGSHWDDAGEFPLNWLDSREALRFKARLRAGYREAYGRSPLAVLKDPRICRFIPLWVSVLRSMRIEPLAIIPIRNPLEVAASLMAREEVVLPGAPRARDGMPLDKALTLWLRHFLDAELHTRRCRRSFVRYEDLLDDCRATLGRVAQDLGIAWSRCPEDIAREAAAFLSPDLRHHACPGDELDRRADVPEGVKRAYRWGLDAAEGHAPPAAELDRICDAIRQAEVAEMSLVSADEEPPAAHPGRATGERGAEDPGREMEAELMRSTRQQRRLAQELAARERELDALRSSASWRLTRPLRLGVALLAWARGALRRDMAALWRALRGRSLGPLRMRRVARAIARSGEFDRDWYLSTYPDVALSGADPLEHYLLHGVAEKRNPSPRFDTADYLSRHPEVAGSGLNPLLHYVLHGRAKATRQAEALPGGPTPVFADLRASVKPGEAYEDPDPSIAAGTEPLVKAIAFYLPQFHSIPENDRWWGKGFTEWRNVARGAPRFAGHYQPRIPRDLGFYDLGDPEVMRRQIEMAKSAGLAGFCYYFYWFDGKRLLERPVDRFLADPSLDFPFCIMWANENWTRRWDGFDTDILIAQTYRKQDETALLEEFHRHFADPRYIRVNERPLLIIYRPKLIPDPARTFLRWKRHWLAEHGYLPLILGVQAFGLDDPREYGLDGAVEFPPHMLARGLPSITDQHAISDPLFTGSIYAYDDVVERSLGRAVPDYPLIRCVMPGWDNDARRQEAATVYHGSTPQKYERWLAEIVRRSARNHSWNRSFVFINAWNEWAEAAYLEPDMRYGSAYLNATARALAATPRGEAGACCLPVLLIGHDACNNGAQLNLRAMGEVLARRFGVKTEFALLEGGPLLASYEAVAPTTVLSAGAAARSALLRLHAKGYRLAIANTTVAGKVVAEAKSAGMRVLSLIHELPGLIRPYELEPAARSIAEHADLIVFPSELVRDKFRGLSGARAERCMVRPQGLYRHEIAADPAARTRLRQELGLPADAVIVLNVAYADRRKGFDLFAQAAEKFTARHPNAYFVWVGDIAPDMAPWAEAAESRSPGRLLTPGAREDIRDYYAGADLFLLTSREDPFPSVVLEALAAGLPVFAFADATGCEPLVARHGEVVPMGDLDALAAAMERRLGEAAGGLPAAEARRREIAVHFDYADYCFWLLERMEPALRRVSVIVPNYNHERYLPERLESIFRQSYPVYEIIVLDDASSDRSLAVIEASARQARREVRVEPNAVNTGRPPAQWRKGLALAGGEYVWIAESDDLADPEFLREAVGMLERTGAGFCFCDSWQIDAEGGKTAGSYAYYVDDIEPGTFLSDFVMPGQELLERFLCVKNVIMNMSGVLWRRSALEAALAAAGDSLDRLRLAADWRLYVQACALGHSVAYIARSLNGHRRHERGITASLDKLSHLAEVREMQQLVARLVRVGVEKRLLAREHIEDAREYLGLPSDPAALGVSDIHLCEKYAQELGVTPEVHDRDFTMRFLLTNPAFAAREHAVKYYFSDGRKSCEMLKGLLILLGRDPAAPMRMLEFAAGYGCLTRHWAKVMPAASVTAWDTNPEAAAFIAAETGTAALAIPAAPDSLPADRAFDVVLALSFLSGLCEEAWGRWLEALWGRVAPGGHLIFTVQGPASAKLMTPARIPAGGLLFEPDRDSGAETATGRSFADRGFVEREVRLRLQEEIALHKPELWWGHQDLYVVTRKG